MPCADRQYYHVVDIYFTLIELGHFEESSNRQESPEIMTVKCATVNHGKHTINFTVTSTGSYRNFHEPLSEVNDGVSKSVIASG